MARKRSAGKAVASISVSTCGTSPRPSRERPLLSPPDYITPHTPDAVLSARKLEYWTWQTHGLCHPARREWVRFMLLAFNRIGLPRVVQLIVLESLKRHELGPPVLMEKHPDDDDDPWLP